MSPNHHTRFKNINKNILIMLCVIFFSVLVFSSPECAASDYQSPRTMALGGSGHAGPLLNDSIYLNPSFTSFLPTYSTTFSYQLYGSGETFPDGTSVYRGHIMNASVQDGRSELFQAGVGYTRREDARFIHVGASKSFMREFGAGIGGKFVFPNDGSNSTVQDATVSASLLMGPLFQASLIVDNLIESQKGKALNLYREFILGTKVNLKGIVMGYFDPHFIPSLSGSGTFGHELGLEFTIMSDFYFRVGNFRNAQIPYEAKYGRGYGIGLGWVGPRLSLDYAISRTIDPIGSTSHSLGATIYF